MNRFCLPTLLAVVSFAVVGFRCSMSHAQSPEPLAILEKAIEAHGGIKNIGKPRMGTLKGKTEGGSVITQEETFDLPKRWKRVTSAILDGRRHVTFDLMIDGRLWQWDSGKEPQETPNKGNAAPYLGFLSLLLDLTHEKVKLSRIQKIKVNGEFAVGFRATWDRAGADYYFDEKTGLLVQASFTYQFDGKNFETRTVYGAYKEDDGVKLPRRRTTYVKGGNFRDFVLLTDYVVTEVSILNQISSDAFALPGKK